ncbi:MAG TPA: hypothetical protein VMR25_26295, partial [Planctomycetaceae bacterium]|nr:hypothetical protein [Planctomycetaceae bacterium]
MSRSRIAPAGLSLTVLLSGSLLASAGERSAEKPIVRKPWGIDTRLPWTSSRVKGTPDPPAPL